MMAENVLKKPERTFELGANVGTAFASQSPKAASSTFPEVINFFYTGKGLHLGKLV